MKIMVCKKLLTSILALICVGLHAQNVAITSGNNLVVSDGKMITMYYFNAPVPEEGLIFYWGGDIYGADSTLINKLTGATDPNYKLINFTGSITDGYVSAKSPTLLKVFDDTIPITCLFSNYNYADTLYFQMGDHTIASDSTEVLPYRLTEIAYYSSSKSGVDSIALASYFGVPEYNSNALTVGVGKTYATIQLAVNASSDDDTIYVHKGNYAEQVSIANKDLTIIGVGSSIITSPAHCFYVTGTNVYERISNFELVPTNYGVRNSSDVSGSFDIDNTSITSYFSVSGTGILKGTNVSIYRIQTASKVVLNSAYLPWCDGIYMYSYPTTDSLVISYSDINEVSTNGFLDLGGDLVIKGFNNTWDNNIIFNESIEAQVKFISNHSTFNQILYKSFYLTNVDSVSFTFTDCEFNSIYEGYMIHLLNQDDVSFTRCTFNDVYSYSLYIDGDGETDTLTIDDCEFYSDNQQKIFINDYTANITDSYFESEETSNIRVMALQITDSVPAYIARNTFISKGNNYDVFAFLYLGSESIGDAATDGKLNGSIVEKNNFLGPSYYGNTIANGHGLFIYAQSVIDRYNYSEGRKFGHVFKNRDKTFYIKMYGNITKNCPNGVIIKGAPHTSIYNNTFYLDTNSNNEYCLRLSYDDLYENSYSDSCSIYNNIFVNYTNSSSNEVVHFVSPSDTVGLEMDYNINCSGGSASNYRINTTPYTFSEFSVSGYDINSFSAAPNFYSLTSLWPITPTDADGNGINLGIDYDDILLNTSAWPDGVNTDTQDEDWDIGAYKVE